MLLDEGRIVEFDSPSGSPTPKYTHTLCDATGKSELGILRKMAGV